MAWEGKRAECQEKTKSRSVSVILFNIIFAQSSTSSGAALRRKAQQSGCRCQQASRISRQNWAGADRADGTRHLCSLIGRIYGVTVHSLEKALAFNNIPSSVWLHAFVARQIRCLSAASDAPATVLLSLSSQICLRYACHSNAPRLIAFKIEMERRCQLLNTSPSRLLAGFQAVKESCSSESLTNTCSHVLNCGAD